MRFVVDDYQDDGSYLNPLDTHPLQLYLLTEQPKRSDSSALLASRHVRSLVESM
jgi:hypothetical protein